MDYVTTLITLLVEVANDQARDYRLRKYMDHLDIPVFSATQLDMALQARGTGLTREQIIRKAVSLLVLDEGLGIFNAQMEIYSER